MVKRNSEYSSITITLPTVAQARGVFETLLKAVKNLGVDCAIGCNIEKDKIPGAIVVQTPGFMITKP